MMEFEEWQESQCYEDALEQCIFNGKPCDYGICDECPIICKTEV